MPASFSDQESYFVADVKANGYNMDALEVLSADFDVLRITFEGLFQHMKKSSTKC